MRIVQFVVALTSVLLMGGARAALVEGFGNISGLGGSGWVQKNSSVPPGEGWFQGNPAVFASQGGAGDSYVRANVRSTDSGSGVIDSWLISPALSLAGGAALTLYTRTDSLHFHRG